MLQTSQKRTETKKYKRRITLPKPLSSRGGQAVKGGEVFGRGMMTIGTDMEAPESRNTERFWTPAFAGVTASNTYYEFIKFEFFENCGLSYWVKG